MTDFIEFLKGNSYPGRGIAVGKDRVYYFIMGRSENSRNRIFSLTEDGIRTEAYDASKMKDPSLIIYHPVRSMGDALIVTNGDQTDTIRDMGDFRKALMTRQFEPDAPNNTPPYFRDPQRRRLLRDRHQQGKGRRLPPRVLLL